MTTTDKAPVTAAELDTLRAYVPTETLRQMNEISRGESAECEQASRAYEEVGREVAEIKARMKKDRQRLKQLDLKRKAYFARPLFPKSDAARTAAIEAARVARAAAIAAGESPKIETLAECSARVKGGK